MKNQTINLSGKDLEKVPKEIESYSDCLDLDLSNNILKRVDHIQGHLIYKIDVSGNKLSRLASLLPLKKSLKILYASQNEITSLEGLHQFTKLQHLSIAENTIHDIPNLSGLRSLRFLDLTSNCLESLPNLSTLPNLETILLAKNEISSIGNASKVLPQSLMVLDISGNKIKDLCQVSYLSCCENLTQLCVQDNPMTVFHTDSYDYRPYILCCCRNLVSLNGFVVTEKESLKGEWLFCQGKGRRFVPGQHRDLTAYLSEVCSLNEAGRLSSELEVQIERALEKKRGYETPTPSSISFQENRSFSAVPGFTAFKENGTFINEPTHRNVHSSTSFHQNSSTRNFQENKLFHNSTKTGRDRHKHQSESANFGPHASNSQFVDSQNRITIPGSNARLYEYSNTTFNRNTTPGSLNRLSKSPNRSFKQKSSGNSDTGAISLINFETSRTQNSAATSQEEFGLSHSEKSDVRIAEKRTNEIIFPVASDSLVINTNESFAAVNDIDLLARSPDYGRSGVPESFQSRIEYSESMMDAAVAIQAWWRGERSRKLNQKNTQKLRMLRDRRLAQWAWHLSQAVEPRLRKNEELSGALADVLWRLNGEIRSLHEEKLKMNEKISSLEESCSRLEDFAESLLPEPTNLQYVPRSSTSGVLSWDATPKRNYKFRLAVDGEVCGEVSSQRALISDLAEDCTHTLTVSVASKLRSNSTAASLRVETASDYDSNSMDRFDWKDDIHAAREYFEIYDSLLIQHYYS